jgi:hypothetical protein
MKAFVRFCFWRVMRFVKSLTAPNKGNTRDKRELHCQRYNRIIDDANRRRNPSAVFFAFIDRIVRNASVSDFLLSSQDLSERKKSDRHFRMMRELPVSALITWICAFQIGKKRKFDRVIATRFCDKITCRSLRGQAC